MDNKAFLVINAIINKENMAEVQTYLGNVMPIFAKNGGKPFARLKTSEKLIGDESSDMVGIIEFPNAEVIRNVVKSDEFQALSESRSRVFTKLNMIICEEM